MNNRQADVRNFHIAFGHPAPEFPVTEWSEELTQLLNDRADWIIEEANELKEAVEQKDLIKVLDALTDAEYFAVGGFVVLGQDGDHYWDAVHSANMDKLGEDGKPIPHPTIPNKIGKRAGWVPPEARHAEVLERIRREALIESLAIRLAYTATVNGTEALLTFDGIPYDVLQLAVFRSRQLISRGENFVKSRFKQLQTQLNEGVTS
ncbi:nucleotide pyrophosphohydrolase [Microbacterium phage Hendrix]|uniref:MazG-like nucleotide pyrophosphohydrolase n=1 Tax=Microbacterium phage Hendrix TaxID=2182341 RepID=A0A2U8UUQ3_9CAUD|nr:nucleotide pyrophosphohydrolase [Microbacterium phage Hendrix]AWN07807.1 MazG-like nucleotide pyrophosphohydrolase [Microbacterium phage Hendrix]